MARPSAGAGRRHHPYDPWGVLPGRRGKSFAPWDRPGLSVDPLDRKDETAKWIVIHPTPRTRMFKEILLGEFGYTEGQGVYNSVRSTETTIRQIQATILSNTLDAVRYDELERDWREHAASRGMDPSGIAERYHVHSEAEAVKVARRVFETWKKTLQNALLDMIRNVATCFSSGDPDNAVSFSKYIDWICCLGMVPLLRGRTRARDSGRAVSGVHAACEPKASVSAAAAVSTTANLSAARSVFRRGREMAEELAARLEDVTIMEYDSAIIEYNFAKRRVRVRHAVTGEKGECLVIWRPVMRDQGVIFDSPLQRIFGEVMACNSLRRHVDVCRMVNTAPVKVVVARRPEDERGTAGARKAVERALGEKGATEEAAGSAAAKLVRLIINMKGMKHVGDITETVREYLEETEGHLLDTATVDTSQAGFGRANRPGAGGGSAQAMDAAVAKAGRIREAFQTSVVTNINSMLEGYVNRLFGTLEDMKAANEDLGNRLRRKEAENAYLRTTAIRAKQAEADARAEAKGRALYGPDGIVEDEGLATRLAELGRDVVDVSEYIGDDSYVANTFQSRYVPAYNEDLTRLSALWEQELIRCFKMTRLTNNQGHETSVSYSNSAITLLVAPYFFSVLRVSRLGVLVTNQEAYRSEEELCAGIFQKSRLETYLEDIGDVFVADVKRCVAEALLPPPSAYDAGGPRNESYDRWETVDEEEREAAAEEEYWRRGERERDVAPLDGREPRGGTGGGRLERGGWPRLDESYARDYRGGGGPIRQKPAYSRELRTGINLRHGGGSDPSQGAWRRRGRVPGFPGHDNRLGRHH